MGKDRIGEGEKHEIGNKVNIVTRIIKNGWRSFATHNYKRGAEMNESFQAEYLRQHTSEYVKYDLQSIVLSMVR